MKKRVAVTELPPKRSGTTIDKARFERRPIQKVISRFPGRPILPHAERALGLVVGLGLLVIVGTILLWLPISAADGQLALNEAFFTSVSAVATTGLTIITPGRDLSVFGQSVLSVLMQLGGLGFMVTAITVFRLIGRPVTFSERLTLRDSLGLISARQILSLTTVTLASVLMIEAVGALVLWLAWRPIFGAGQAVYYAIFHSISAFTNSSFDLFTTTPNGVLNFPTDAVTLLTLSVLIFLGGIGIPVVSDLARWRSSRKLSLHSRLALATSAVLIVAGTIFFFAAEKKFQGVYAGDSSAQLLLLSFFHSVSSRTSGFVISASFSQLEPANGLLLLALMFIGASPASMGGGITTTTFAVLVLAMWNFARGSPEIRAGRRVVPLEMLYKATAIVTAATAVIIVVTWLLLYTQDNITLAQALIESTSAFATSGISVGVTPRLNLFGQLLIAGLMFFGRVGTLTIIIALTRPSVVPPVRYPEERILMG